MLQKEEKNFGINLCCGSLLRYFGLSVNRYEFLNFNLSIGSWGFTRYSHSKCLSVRPSVCHTRWLFQNGWTYHQTFSPSGSTIILHRESKKRDTILLSTVSRKILSPSDSARKEIIKDSTTPQTRRYTTLWNMNVDNYKQSETMQLVNDKF